MSVDLDNIESSYRTYRVRKPNGGWRVITEPCDELKVLQKEIADRLEREIPVSEYAFGFKKGVSCVDSAKMHVGKDWILTVDVKDFFPSIGNDHLTFLNDTEKKICTLNGGLPQGSPSSPIISNVVMRDIDKRLQDIFSKRNVSYSRYADDICLSGFGRIDIEEHVERVSGVLISLALNVNKKKTKFMPKYVRQTVLGIVVNEKISINRKTRKNLRSALHKGNISESTEGMLSYINMVNVDQYRKLVKERTDVSFVQM
jgi:RNA-directed DNA polymerase